MDGRIIFEMAESPLSERLEYAILATVNRNPSQATHQDSWGGWCNLIRQSVSEFADADLLAAFRRLWKRDVLRLTKPDNQRRDAHEYSGSEADTEAFFFIGPFNATITDEGRSVWDRAEEPRTTVFISHIGGERAVALRLQTLIQTAFTNRFPVFVSSDPISLGGGEEWYHYILENLAKAKVVLVLLSPDSAEKQWINFEAGFGRGQKSRVIPILFRGLSFDTLQYPLKGLQGYQLHQLREILREISRRMGVPVGSVDLDVASEEIQQIQTDLPTKKLALEFRPMLSYPKWNCEFFIVNEGNRDVEPLEVTIWIPSAILNSPYQPVIDAAILEVRAVSVNNVNYAEITYRNNREPKPDRFSKPERLVTCVSPGSAQVLQLVRPEIRYPLDASELATPIRYRIVAKNIRPAEGSISIKDKLVPKP
jgi:hypothetical protein